MSEYRKKKKVEKKGNSENKTEKMEIEVSDQ